MNIQKGAPLTECLHQIINSIHEVILGLPAGPKRLQFWSTQLSKDPEALKRLLPLILRSKRFNNRLPLFIDKYVPNRNFMLEHSQNGEVFKLIELIIEVGVPSKLIVDVGANGARGSNSYDLLRTFGWHGILIEANSNLHDDIRRDFEGLSYRLIHAAISNYSGEADFFVSSGREASSLKKRGLLRKDTLVGKMTVPVRRLPDVLEECAVPKDFGVLSIDAEGEDLKILNDTICNSEYRPEWIIFEAGRASERTTLKGLVSSAVESSYNMLGSTRVNLILKRRHIGVAAVD